MYVHVILKNQMKKKKKTIFEKIINKHVVDPPTV